MGLYLSKRPPAVRPLAFSEFVHELDAGAVTAVTFSDRAMDVALRDGTTVHTIAPPEFLGANASFVTDLVRRRIRVDVTPAVDPSAISYPAMIAAAAFFGLICFTVYRTTAGRIPNSGRARNAERGQNVITFQDVAGVDEAKDEVKEIVDFLRHPGRFSAIGGHVPKGVLLVGPPGTGKTLLARSIAGEAGVPFLFASGSDFVEMDGFEPHQGIVVVAATNRQDILDPALLRPGRFDRHVTVGNPDLRGREAILRVHARKVAVEPDLDLRSIARGTPGFSGADLANLVNEAALFAARAARTTVTDSDMSEARDKVLMGVERRSIILSEMDRTNCAYHEAGHALVAALLPLADPLHKVTIIPRGRAMGVTMQLPEADRHTYTRDYLRTQVAVLMGGRVAEELFMNHMTSGASNDIERATDIAERMVCEFGMSDLGPLAYRKPGNSFEADRPHAVSEATSQRVDDEIRKIVMNGYDHARWVIERNKEPMRVLAEALLEQESLEAGEIKTLLHQAGVQRG